MLYIPAAFLATALTGSRGALVALLGAILTFAICTDLRKRVAISIGAAAFLLLISVLPRSITWRLSTTSEEISHGTLDGRRDLWDRGILIFQEHPLQGLGVGATFGALDYPAHNTPLELLIEGGVVSLGLFYGGLAHSMYRVWRVAGQEGTALIAICAAWFVGTLSISWDANLNTWFIFAMLLSVGSTCRRGRVANRIGHRLKVAIVAQ
jgi:O-antigen ligase